MGQRTQRQWHGLIGLASTPSASELHPSLVTCDHHDSNFIRWSIHIRWLAWDGYLLNVLSHAWHFQIHLVMPNSGQHIHLWYPLRARWFLLAYLLQHHLHLVRSQVKGLAIDENDICEVWSVLKKLRVSWKYFRKFLRSIIYLRNAAKKLQQLNLWNVDSNRLQ